MRMMRAILLGILLLATASCSSRYYIRLAPPPEPTEVISPSPGELYVWVQGFWTWGGSAYVWSPGHWAKAPEQGVTWVPGVWMHTPKGYYWVPGHWRQPGK